MVLDPFAGTGVTLAVATGHGHDAIGIDLDPANADLALQRVGPLMLEVVGDISSGAATSHNVYPGGHPRFREGYQRPVGRPDEKDYGSR